MSAVADALSDLYAALSAVPGVRLHRGVGMTIAPPATAVGPPTIRRGAYDPDPTEATFQVAVIVARSERALDDLLRLEALVTAVLQERTGAAVNDSTPGTWPSGGTDLPAYLIDVDYSL